MTWTQLLGVWRGDTLVSGGGFLVARLGVPVVMCRGVTM